METFQPLEVSCELVTSTPNVTLFSHKLGNKLTVMLFLDPQKNHAEQIGFTNLLLTSKF